MLLFGNKLNKFTYTNFITEIIYNNHTRGYYYGNLQLPGNKLSCVFFGLITRYLFSCQLVKVKISSSIKGPALCSPFITSLIYICIIVVITNCV